MQGYTSFPKIQRPLHNSRRQRDDKKQGPYRGTAKLGHRGNVLVGDRAPEKSAPWFNFSLLIHTQIIRTIEANKMHYFSTLFWYTILHVSDRFTVHHHESWYCIHRIGICPTSYVDCLIAIIRIYHDARSSECQTQINNNNNSRMRRGGHVERMGNMRRVYRVLVGRPEVKRPLGRPRRGWENITMDIPEMEWGGMDWIDLAQNRDRWRGP